MEIYQELKKNQQIIQDLLRKLMGLNNPDFTEISSRVDEINGELVPHMRAEAKVFYEALGPFKERRAMLKDLYSDHGKNEALLRALRVEVRMGLPWRATAEKLHEALEKHMQQEEDRIFQIAKLYFNPKQAREMGENFLQLKQEVRKENVMQSSLELIANMALASVATSFRRHNQMTSARLSS